MNEIIFLMSTNEKEHVQLTSLHGTLDGERGGGEREWVIYSLANPDHFDMDLDPAFHFDTDLDHAFPFDTRIRLFDMDPDPFRFKEVMYLERYFS
jgi:hypothetical protein